MQEPKKIFKKIFYIIGTAYFLYSILNWAFKNDSPEVSSSHHYQQEEKNTKQKEAIIMPHKVQPSEPLYQNPYGSEEPLPSEVREEDQDMYNWITDHPDYNGDWEYWIDKYENSQQQGDEYDDEF